MRAEPCALPPTSEREFYSSTRPFSPAQTPGSISCSCATCHGTVSSCTRPGSRDRLHRRSTSCAPFPASRCVGLILAHRSGNDPSFRSSPAGDFVPAAASLLGLAAHIRRHRIEILHSTDRPRDAIACAVLAALTGAKALIHVHVNYGDWMSCGVTWALGRADAIVGVSQHTAENFRGGRVPSGSRACGSQCDRTLTLGSIA